MRKISYISLALTLSLLFVACSKEEEVPIPDQWVEISFRIDNYVSNITTTRATTDVGSAEEQRIDNLYLFLFDSNGANAVKYTIDAAAFTGGTWESANKKVKLSMTQAEAGTRQVYVVANVSNTLKATLGGITTLAGLQGAMETTATPWSATLKTPILMSGSATHNFITSAVLNAVPLKRALAKLEINMKLTAAHQSVPTVTGVAQYRYKLTNFDKNTYVLKPATKTNDLVSSANWVNWNDAVSSYTLESGKATSLKVVTYLNERDHAGTTIEIELPYNGSGPLPPPEFGPEVYKLHLPAKIERNHWYQYDVEK